jgi:hypothetical protein
VELAVDSDSDIQKYLEEDYKLLTHYQFPLTWESREALSKDNLGVLPYEISENYLKYGWFKFVRSMSLASKLRNEHERRNYTISPYEWVITTSPQMEPQTDIDDLTILDNEYMYSPRLHPCGGFYTSFYIGNPEHANYMGTLYKGAIDKTIGESKIDSEPVFLRFVQKKYHIHQSLKISFNRVRYDGTRIDH